jgi:hypothetical protein
MFTKIQTFKYLNIYYIIVINTVLGKPVDMGNIDEKKVFSNEVSSYALFCL